MAVNYLKKAEKSPTTDSADTARIVADILAEIEAEGEACTRRYAEKFDNWTGDIVVSRDTIEAATRSLPETLKEDIQFARDRVMRFAQAQRGSMSEIEIELSDGLFAGQKLIPVAAAGCYVPGGRYAHVASAIMSVGTASVAGVEHVTVCSPPKPDVGVHPAILYTADLCGADTIMALGGVQAIAAMAFGHFTGRTADILVGPGNRFVAEAKRLLFGRVGIDMFAGPTEIAIIADGTADAEIVATDLVSQCEHGPDSPAWLISLDAGLADKVAALTPEMIAKLPEPARGYADAAWRDFGEIVHCDSREEAVRGQRRLCRRASGGPRERSRLVARQFAQLRFGVPRRRDHGRVRRQVLRHQSRAADQGRGALYRRPERRQVHQDRDLPAHEPRGQPHGRPGRGPHLTGRGHGRPCPHLGRAARQVLPGRGLRPGP